MFLECIQTIFHFIEGYKKSTAYSGYIKNLTQSVIDELTMDNSYKGQASLHLDFMRHYAFLPWDCLDTFDSKNWQNHTLLKRRPKVKIDAIGKEVSKLKKRSKELEKHYPGGVKHHLILEEESLQRLRQLFQELLATLERKGFLENLYVKIFLRIVIVAAITILAKLY